MEITRRTALATGAAATAVSAVPALAQRRPTGSRPNFLHICVDDMRLADLDYMPTVKHILRAQGLDFTRHYTAFTFCAPSRIGMLTGLQAHNHGVTTNDNAYALYEPMQQYSIAPWLQTAGYYTGHVGKFINDYLKSDPVPPGYNFWRAIAGSFEVYYNFMLNEDGKHVKYNSGQYVTDVLNQKVQDFLAGVPSGQPWALWYWPNACHGPCTPANQDIGTFDPNDMPLPPSFNRNIVNGKQRPLLTSDQIADIRNTWALRLETLQAVDRGIAQILTTLEAGGQLANTYIFFTSDNGFQEGEHCIDDSKGVLYDESVRLPLLVLGPTGITAQGVSSSVCNIDVTAAMVDLGGATVVNNFGNAVDGRSMAPLFSGNTTGWNKACMSECRFSTGVFSLHYSYVEWNNGVIELFDRSVDPYEMTNVAGEPAYASIQASLASALHSMAGCAGTTCEWTSNFPPPP